MKKKSEHYVNNKEFLLALVDFKAECKVAEENGEPKPRINNYIG